MQEKSFFEKNKVRFAVLIVVAVVGTLLPLAILGKIEVTSDQVFSFAEWLFGLFVGGHAVQRGSSYVAQAIRSPQSGGSDEGAASSEVEGP